jgi:sugar/nucleoside kinase (ribokinase family)
LYRPAVTQEAMRRARAAGSRTSLDLASFEVVDRCWAVLTGLLEAGLVDILFLNEDEARAVCCAAGAMVSAVADHDDAVEAAQRLLLRFVSVVVVSRGKKGCVAADRNGTRAVAAADDVKVIDTVGAGDYFSAGFLHAWLDGASLETCAKCGCACGSAAVQVEGAELPVDPAAALRCRVLTILDEENGRKNGATDDVGVPLGASNTRFYESESAR